MHQILKFIHLKWNSLLISFFLCFPIAFIAAIAGLDVLNKSISLLRLALVTIILFVLFFWFIWFVTNNFLTWLKNKTINFTRWDIFLFCGALIPILIAIFYGCSRIENDNIPPILSSTTTHTIEIVPATTVSPAGHICILEMKYQNGEKILPEKKGASKFLSSGDWLENSQGCFYYSPGDVPGILKFTLTKDTTSIYFTILFREDNSGARVLVRIDGKQIADVDLGSELAGNQSVTYQLEQYFNTSLFLWNAAKTAGGTALLILLLMILTLTFGNFDQQQFKVVGSIIQKHPWIIFIPVAIILGIMFWPSGSNTSADVGYYLSLAKNLFHGNGYVNPDLSPNIYRGPVFPLLISFGYTFFGESFRSALIIERIFWVLTILMAYLISRELFNPRVGIIATTFVLASFIISIAFTYIWTDGPLTFFILLVQWMFWSAYKNKRGGWWYFLLGLVMGMTYLLKQTALFIIPLPLLMWILFSDYRNRQNFKKLVIYIGAFALCYFGWMGYVYLVGGSQRQLAADFNWLFNLGSRMTSVFKGGSSSVIQPANQSTFSLSLVQIISIFYTRDIQSYFGIAPMFIIGIGFTLFQALVKKSKADSQLGLGLLLFSFLIPIQVVANFGIRQNLYFYIIGLICISAFVERLAAKASSNQLSNALIVVTSACLVIIQIYGGSDPLPKLPTATDPKTLNYFSDFQVVADWIDTNIKPTEKIMTSERAAAILHILTKGNRVIEILSDCIGEKSFFPAKACTPPYISLWTNNGASDPDNPRDLLQGLSEPELIKTLHEKNVKYVIVNPKILSLYFYLKIHPDFKEVYNLATFAIFHVERSAQPISTYPNTHWGTCLGLGLPEYLQNLEQSNPIRYTARLRDEFSPWMGLSEQDLKAFQNWQGCTFDPTFPGVYRLP
jgi:4-amino-4-deoxy-L-arabinose transferase-like glycosyltransferase